MYPKVQKVLQSNHRLNQFLYNHEQPMSLECLLTIEHKGHYYNYVKPLHTLNLESFY